MIPNQQEWDFGCLYETQGQYLVTSLDLWPFVTGLGSRTLPCKAARKVLTRFATIPSLPASLGVLLLVLEAGYAILCNF